MLTLHHLQRSQSERIVWLLEELGIPYELKTYPRDKNTLMCPPELQALHPTQAAPVIQDGPITLAESGAITQYILTKYDPQGTLSLPPTHPNYPDYLYFLHFANGYFQPALGRYGAVLRSGMDSEDKIARFAKRGFLQSLGIVEERVKGNEWLAGGEFSAADVMVVFSLTTMRLFMPYSLEGYPGILGYLGRVKGREGYRRAMEKGDPGFEVVVGGAPPEPLLKK